MNTFLEDKSSLTIHTQTPIRIDLSGGTLDIWPLYLLLENPITINLGIDLCAETKLYLERKKGAGLVRLISQDQVQSLECLWSDLYSLKAPPHLELHLRILKHFISTSDTIQENQIKLKDLILTIETKALSPSGAGLGGSSSLAISLAAAISLWTHGIEQDKFSRPSKRKWLIEIVKDIESQVIQKPAGLQDYFGASFGSLQKMSWGIHKHKRQEYPPEAIQMLSERILLFFSGKSHHSGMSNWDVYKGFLEKDPSTLQKFQAILDATHLLDRALLNTNWEATCEAINKEWHARHSLAPHISTPEIDEACSIALKEGASSFKICGAGGGGCFFVLLPNQDPHLRARLIQLISKGSIAPLPFNINQTGLKILEYKMK